MVNSAGQPVVATTLIEASVFNAFTADVATGLSLCITKDGQQTVTANIPFGGFKLTGVGAATARTDAASLASIQDGTGVYSATVGGTADVITLTPSPAITAYAAGQTFRFIASGANTTNVTVAISSLAAKAITKNGTTALIAGDIPSGSMVEITYDGTRFIINSGRITSAKADVAAHATTSDIWVAREIVLTGGAVTFTALAAAPYVGAVAWVKQNAAHVWTDGATFNVQGGANYTAAADDWIRVYATTVSTFEVTIFRALGNAQGTFTIVATGFTTDPNVTATARYSITNNIVHLFVPTQLSGTSNSTGFSLGGLPSIISPASTQAAGGFVFVDNSVQGTGPGYSSSGAGVIVLYKDWTAAAWTASGTKTLGAGTTLIYNLS